MPGDPKMSDKKNLLNESQIRQFMKLASLTPLTPGFVRGLTERSATEVDESNGRGKYESAAGPPGGDGGQNARNEGIADADEELDFAADDLEGGSPEEDEEADVDLELADDEMGPEEEADGGRMISVDDFLSALESALEGVMGDEVEIDSEEMADDDTAVEDDAAADMDMAAATDDMDMAADEEEEMFEGKATDELVEQITKRVAARILKSALAKK
jgi:hypothetical protein|tara:strand:- start:48 stop:695 length:648 start_codon:yes stop_codon:yes gene_type:complete